MADIQQKGEAESVKIEVVRTTDSDKLNEDIDSDLVMVKKEVKIEIANIKTDANACATEVVKEIDTNLVRIKTEPGLVTDNNDAPLEADTLETIRIKTEPGLVTDNNNAPLEADTLETIRIKTEPGLVTDNNNASLSVHVLHQEADSLETIRIKTEPSFITENDTDLAVHLETASLESILVAVKQETDCGPNVNNGDVTVHLLAAENILAQSGADSQNNLVENNSILENSDAEFINSELPPRQFTSTEIAEIINRSANQITASGTISIPSVSNESTKKKWHRKKKVFPECEVESHIKEPQSAKKQDLESLPRKTKRVRKRKIFPECEVERNLEEPQSTKEQNLESLPPKKKRGRKTKVLEECEIESQLEEPQSSKEQNLEPLPPKKKRARKKDPANDRKNKDFVCPFCDRKMNKNYFAIHVRIHTGEKPFKCPICPYATHFSGPLLFHMESHHPNDVHLITKDRSK